MGRIQIKERSQDEKMRVLLSVTNTGWIHKLVVRTIMPILSDSRYCVRYIDPTWVPYENSLNRIAKDVVDQGWDYWLNIDSDNPPTKNPLDLIELDLDVVGLPTPTYKAMGNNEWPICWNAVDWLESDGGYREHPEKTGLQQVDAVGSGCMIVSRRVLEGVEAPWFVRETDEFGRATFGPDFTFCRKVIENGFSIWANYDYPCQHINEIELIEGIKHFSNIGKDATCHDSPME